MAPSGFVVYGQYTMAKGCIQALRIELRLRTSLSRGILAIYHPLVPYCLNNTFLRHLINFTSV